jgi:hypothetical protein
MHCREEILRDTNATVERQTLLWQPQDMSTTTKARKGTGTKEKHEIRSEGVVEITLNQSR